MTNCPYCFGPMIHELGGSAHCEACRVSIGAVKRIGGRRRAYDEDRTIAHPGAERIGRKTLPMERFAAFDDDPIIEDEDPGTGGVGHLYTSPPPRTGALSRPIKGLDEP